MPYVITDGCLDIMDRSCMDQCPVDCIEQGERMLYINPEECIDCGACEPACPQEAIYLAETLPAHLKKFEAINAAFYTATTFGPTAGIDPPEVAVLPAHPEK
jgi:NAD-dependent dihydropyrimidine dehydrogenase PreA subunit